MTTCKVHQDAERFLQPNQILQLSDGTHHIHKHGHPPRAFQHALFAPHPGADDNSSRNKRHSINKNYWKSNGMSSVLWLSAARHVTKADKPTAHGMQSAQQPTTPWIQSRWIVDLCFFFLDAQAHQTIFQINHHARFSCHGPEHTIPANGILPPIRRPRTAPRARSSNKMRLLVRSITHSTTRTSPYELESSDSLANAPQWLKTSI